MTNVNEGHRARLRQRMMKEGLQSFQDHEILEFLLFQSIPRRDTNKLAHDLLNKFGSFANVLDAAPKQLMTVKGISEATACNLSLLKEVLQRYRRSAAEKISLSTLGSIVRYTQKIISESYVEKLVAVYVDNTTNFLVSEEFCSNSTQEVNVDVKHIVTTALQAGASGVILFHCHVKGLCVPSEDDRDFTERVYITLANMNIVLLEHIIFNNRGEYYSFYKEKDIAHLAEKYNNFRFGK